MVPLNLQPRYFLFGILLMLGLPWALATELQAQDRSAPPPVVERKVSVERGKQVVIPLGIHGGRGEQLEFLIRAKPAKGRLSKVKRTGLTTAAILYTAPLDESVSSEFFTYAVSGRYGVSAPGMVQIEIIAPPVVPWQLSVDGGMMDFGSVLLGESGSRILEVRNSGGEVAEGSVIVPEPWRVEGSADFKINGGESVSFTIRFQPTKADTFRGVIGFSSDSKLEVPLVAEASAPFIVSPDLLELIAPKGKQTREGNLQVVNRTGKTLTLKVGAGPNLLTNESLTVKPRATAALAVFADPSKGGQMDEEITIASATWKTSVKVRIFSVGTLVRFSQNMLEFENAETEKTTTVEARLENPGSEKAYVRFKVEAPFEAVPEKLEIPAGESASVKIHFSPKRAGEFSQTLEADNNGQIAKIDIKAIAGAATNKPDAPKTETVKANEENKPTPAAMSEPVATSDEAVSAQAETDLDFPVPQTRGEIANLRGIVLRELSQKYAVFEWPSEWGAIVGLKLQSRTLGLDPAGKIQVSWSDYPEVEFEGLDKIMRAKVEGLKANSSYAFRVVSADIKGGVTAVCTVQFVSSAKEPWIKISGVAMILMALFVALGVMLWRVWLQNRHSGGW